MDCFCFHTLLRLWVFLHFSLLFRKPFLKWTPFLKWHFLRILHDLLKNFLFWKIYEKYYVKVLLKCKSKRNLCIFFVPHLEVPYSWYFVHIILTRSYEKKSSASGDYVAIPYGFRQFWQYFSCNFAKKFFLSAVIVSVNRRRKDTEEHLCLSASIQEGLP